MIVYVGVCVCVCVCVCLRLPVCVCSFLVAAGQAEVMGGWGLGGRWLTSEEELGSSSRQTSGASYLALSFPLLPFLLLFPIFYSSPNPASTSSHFPPVLLSFLFSPT